MHPPLTYELRVGFLDADGRAIQTKARLIDWLLLNGVESFVEGELAVDINQNQDEPPRDYYTELGGDKTPVSIYRYSRESLDDLRTKIEHAFGAKIAVELSSLATETWMEGWKESFKPFATETFFVRPPWIQSSAPKPGLLDLVIEPGMAFGTGQHATTRLCLEELGALALVVKSGGHATKLKGQRVFDVGTGTGILAIGAKKLGYGEVIGTDIEDDAILASEGNAKLNAVSVKFRKGSLPTSQELGEGFDVVLANILAVVLIRLMDDLASITKSNGLLVLSGLLVEEVEEVTRHAEAAGLGLVRVGRHEGWAAIAFEKRR